MSRPAFEYGRGFVRKSPDLITDNYHIAFSGGRSSGMMVKLLLEANGGKWPANYKIVFCNTGKEDPRTLDFVEECAQRWSVDITWLELTAINNNKVSYQQVNYARAARAGEPFNVVFRDVPDVVPNRSTRLCTVFMKSLTSRAYLTSLGWSPKQSVAYGFRFDEPNRLHRVRLRCASKNPDEYPIAPLLDAGISRPDVFRFWAEQPFDLQTPALLSNCDLCLLKRHSLLMQVINDYPEKAQWWLDRDIGRKGNPEFRMFAGGYAGLVAKVKAGQPPPEEEYDGQELECACTD
jgi:3'-phosphoadenosine 5'-phosphosulfate sulfotransferase (PAPS reductase)/FAD synthetase